jgi:hypothetical protein
MKPFDQELYDKDDNAKYVVIDYLATLGIQARVNPDPYGIDLLADWYGSDYEIEVEVKHNWSGPEFPFDSLHYSARKVKFLNPKAEVRFITLNNEWTHAAIVTGQNLLGCKIVEKKTKYTERESFLEVPLDKVRLVSLASV